MFSRITDARLPLVDLVLITCISVFWYVWLSAVGIAMSPDSTHYLFFSLKIHHYLDFGSVFTVWPPAYPSLVALAQFIHPSPVVAATIISSISLFFSLTFMILILRQLRVGFAFRVSALLLLVFNTAFLTIYHYAWSEGPFVALSTGMFYFLIRHHDTQSIKYLALAAVLASGAALTRYLGYFAIAMFLLYLVYDFFRVKQYSLYKIALLAFLVIIVSAPSLGWMLRNYTIDGTLHGPRTSSEISLLLNSWRLLRSSIFDNWPWILGVLFIAPVLAFGWYSEAVKVIKSIRSQGNTITIERYFPVILLGTGTLLYFSLTVYSASAARFDVLGTRFSAVYYPWLLIILAFALNVAFEHISNLKKSSNGGIGQLSIFWMLATALALSAWAGPNQYFTSDFGNRDLSHLELGFGQSPSKEALADWLEEIVSLEQNNLTLFIFFDRPERSRPHLGRSLLFRPGVFREISGASYKPKGEDLLVSFRRDDELMFQVSYNFASDVEEMSWGRVTRPYAILVDKRHLDLFSSEHDEIAHCMIREVGSLYFSIECGFPGGISDGG